jgi:uncharacterized membrane protein
MRPAALALAAALLLPAAAANATQELTPEPGISYRVTGVAAGDVLNVRRAADPGAEKIGSLSAGASGVVVTGSRVEWDGAVWWGVVLPRGESGWVNARFLTPESDRAGPETFPLACFGTEPFWSLRVGGGKAVFSDPEGGEVAFSAGKTVIAAARLGRFAVPLSSRAGHGTLAAFRAYDFCTDGMSESSYPYEAIVMLPTGVVYSGCCERAGR